MILKAYTVYDMKTEAYLPPFYCKTNGEAVRAFADTVNTEGHQFGNHAEDYTLYAIGSFDDSLGELDKTVHENLGCALTFLIEDPIHAT